MLCFLQQGWQIGACRRGQLLTLAIKEEINTTQVRVSLKGLKSMNNLGIFFLGGSTTSQQCDPEDPFGPLVDI